MVSFNKKHPPRDHPQPRTHQHPSTDPPTDSHNDQPTNQHTTNQQPTLPILDTPSLHPSKPPTTDPSSHSPQRTIQHSATARTGNPAMLVIRRRPSVVTVVAGNEPDRSCFKLRAGRSTIRLQIHTSDFAPGTHRSPTVSHAQHTGHDVQVQQGSARDLEGDKAEAEIRRRHGNPREGRDVQSRSGQGSIAFCMYTP